MSARTSFAILITVAAVACERWGAEFLSQSHLPVGAETHLKQLTMLPSLFLAAVMHLKLVGPYYEGRLRDDSLVWILCLFCFGPGLRTKFAWEEYSTDPSLQKLACVMNPWWNAVACTVFLWLNCCGKVGAWMAFRLYVCAVRAGTLAIFLWLRVHTRGASDVEFPPLQGSFEGSVAMGTATLLFALWLTPANRAWLSQSLCKRLGQRSITVAPNFGFGSEAAEFTVTRPFREGRFFQLCLGTTAACLISRSALVGTPFFQFARALLALAVLACLFLAEPAAALVLITCIVLVPGYRLISAVVFSVGDNIALLDVMCRNAPTMFLASALIGVWLGSRPEHILSDKLKYTAAALGFFLAVGAHATAFSRSGDMRFLTVAIPCAPLPCALAAILASALCTDKHAKRRGMAECVGRDLDDSSRQALLAGTVGVVVEESEGSDMGGALGGRWAASHDAHEQCCNPDATTGAIRVRPHTHFHLLGSWDDEPTGPLAEEAKEL